jgi:hypothetical protein
MYLQHKLDTPHFKHQFKNHHTPSIQDVQDVQDVHTTLQTSKYNKKYLPSSIQAVYT